MDDRIYWGLMVLCMLVFAPVVAAVCRGVCWTLEWIQSKTRRIRWGNCFTWTDSAERAVGRRIHEAFGILGRRVIGFLGPSGCYVQPSLDQIVTVAEPDGLVIDERCPACAGSGRLRVDLLAVDVDEEREWRELEAKAKKSEEKATCHKHRQAYAALLEARRRQDDAVAALKDNPGLTIDEVDQAIENALERGLVRWRR